MERLGKILEGMDATADGADKWPLEMDA